MQIKKFPHEFLARWGRDGLLQGYHVVTVDIACDDTGVPLRKDPADPLSENLLEKFGEATTVERAGVTLDELLGAIHTGALASMDAARASEAAAKKVAASMELERDEALSLAAGTKTQLGETVALLRVTTGERDAATLERDRLAAELAAATARITALQVDLEAALQAAAPPTA